MQIYQQDVKIFGNDISEILQRVEEFRGLELTAFCQLLSVELSLSTNSTNVQYLFLYLEQYRPELFPVFLPVLVENGEKCFFLAINSNSNTPQVLRFIEMFCEKSPETAIQYSLNFFKQFTDFSIDLQEQSRVAIEQEHSLRARLMHRKLLGRDNWDAALNTISTSRLLGHLVEHSKPRFEEIFSR